MNKTCANCQIFKKFVDNPDVTCMDECVGQTGCSLWMGPFTREEIERYSKV